MVDGPVEIRGALALERREAGVLPRRLPAWTVEQYPDPFMDFVSLMPSGVRLVFRTDARVLELDLLTTVRHFDGSPNPWPSGMLDLRVDGKLADQVTAPVGNILRLANSRADGRLEPGEPGTVRFAGLPDGPKNVEIWLPQMTPCELVELRADGAVEPPAPHSRHRWVHYGSSVSHCTQADSPTGTWPVVAASVAGVEVTNLGMAGNAMLDPFSARTIRDLPADLISLKLGANPLGKGTLKLRTFIPLVHGFIDTVREGHPDVPLIVATPIILPGREELESEADGAAALDPGDVPEGTLTMAMVREALARIVRVRARHDPNLHFLDGRDLFGADDVGDLPDGVHPNAAGYRRMGERFAAIAFGPGGAFAR